MKIIIHWLVSTSAVIIAAYLVQAVTLSNLFVALVVAIVLGIVNTLIKPFILILTLPINILTLGLFTLVINALMILLTSWIVPGFVVPGFWVALWFGLILSAVNFILHKVANDKK